MSTPMSRARLARLRVYTSTSPLESSPRPHSTPPTSPCTYLHDIYGISIPTHPRYLIYLVVHQPVAGGGGGEGGLQLLALRHAQRLELIPSGAPEAGLQYSTVQNSTVQCSTVQYWPGWRPGRCQGLAGCGTSSESPPRSGSSPPAPRARPPPPPCSAMFWLDVRLDRYRYYISRPCLHCMLSQASCLHASWLVSAQPGARLFSQNQAAQR